MTRRRAFGYTLLCLIFGLLGDLLAETYIGRLPHHAGYYLVPVADAIDPTLRQPAARPRHAVVVVIDGLRADKAAGMASVQKLRQAGQCRDTDVGPLSVSRPVYAVISTGLEPDRAGSRNNDLTAPLYAESLWQVARRDGLRVTAVSELPWFQQLFPDGFSDFKIVARSADHFATPEPEVGELALFHPIYVDEAGHDFGGASPSYAAAVLRADQEFSRLLERLDLSRDLVVFTSDHGHSDGGGHGARSKVVSQVLTCFAGRGVSRDAADRPFDSRTIAGTLSVLLQLPFPRHMRAGEDSLDTLFEIVDVKAFSPTYLANRRAAVQRFRDENAAAVGRFLNRSTGTWSALYARAQRQQLGRGLLVLCAAAVLCGVLRRRVLPHPLRALLFCGGTWALYMLVWRLLRGSFDFTSMNERREFIRWAILCYLIVAPVVAAAHLLWVRDRTALVEDWLRMLFVLSLGGLMHIAAFGWPLNFPLPNAFCFFYPFIGGALLAFMSLTGFIACLIIALRTK
jgi:hypothetical protein